MTIRKSNNNKRSKEIYSPNKNHLKRRRVKGSTVNLEGGIP